MEAGHQTADGNPCIVAKSRSEQYEYLFLTDGTVTARAVRFCRSTIARCRRAGAVYANTCKTRSGIRERNEWVKHFVSVSWLFRSPAMPDATTTPPGD